MFRSSIGIFSLFLFSPLSSFGDDSVYQIIKKQDSMNCVATASSTLMYDTSGLIKFNLPTNDIETFNQMTQVAADALANKRKTTVSF